jgi:nucleoside-diphosphate-sugar epimerase
MRDVGADLVVKGKSMVSEEIGLNAHLEANGITPVETDLGEWILQLAGETPSHLVMPAIHKRKEQIAELFTRVLERPFPPDDIERMVRAARTELRERFLASGVGLSGTNALVAEGGSVMLVCNEGNNRMSVALPPVHIVTVGIEKLLPTYAAAMKQVPAAEYNPMECIKTNVLGAENVINAAIYNNVKDVIALSTDKAAAPINLYGATKLCSDKLFVAANNMRGKRDLKLSVVRYGNVFGSRGSVVPAFLKMKNSGTITITHDEMTRFTISLEEGVDFVLSSLRNHMGGEIFIPKIPSYKILDVAQAIAPDAKKKITGIRPGEKLHEEMITETDALSTIEFDNYYVITPSTPMWDPEELVSKFKGKRVEQNFRYNSGENSDWVSVEQLRKDVVKYCEENPEYGAFL